MQRSRYALVFVGITLPVTSIAFAQSRELEVPLRNWPTPLYWQPTQSESEGAAKPGVREAQAPQAQTPPNSLVFVGMTPCRVVDTRVAVGFPAPFGGTGPLVGGAPPTNGSGRYPFYLSAASLSHACPIPNYALAYSLNITVVPAGPLGFLSAAPSPITLPAQSSTMNDPGGTILANAAIVPAGSPNGSIDIYVSDTSQVIIDINGFYAPATGITLGIGSAVAPSLSFTSDPGTGIFSSRAGALNIATGGTNRLTVRTDGDLDLTGNVRKDGDLLLTNQTFNCSPATCFSLGVGIGALGTSYRAGNNAFGAFALASNTGAANNLALGDHALTNLTFGDSNVAVGNAALVNNLVGGENVALGYSALSQSTGDDNIAVGSFAGINLSTGHHNIFIGSSGVDNVSGNMMLGDDYFTTSTKIAGIAGKIIPFAQTVVINPSGQMGTILSSRRFKQDIVDIGDGSQTVMALRPVAFRYKELPAGSPEYGLVAEEVAEIFPDLVVYGKDGQPETVQYHKLSALLLNELQRQETKVEDQQRKLAALEQAVRDLRDRVSGADAKQAKAVPK